MSTQIILTAPVDHLGAKGDTIMVADGYAKSFLFQRAWPSRRRPATCVAWGRSRRSVKRPWLRNWKTPRLLSPS